MHIVFCEVSKEDRSYLEEHLSEHKLTFFDKPANLLSIKQLKSIKDCELLSIFIHTKVDSILLKSFPKIKMIITRSTGIDHIDREACTKRGIHMHSIQHYGEQTIAEHTFALLLALTRKIPKVIKVKEDVTGKHCTPQIQGIEIYGKTLGVIGVGKIGQQVIKIAKGFNMNVLATDSHPKKELEKVLGFRYTTLSDLLKNSDIISIHVPAMASTKHLVGKEEFKKMKNGSILINTSRGSLIDTSSLIENIKNNKLEGVALDVLEKIEDSRVFEKYSNVLITPHIAFYTREAKKRILDQTIALIKNHV